MSRVHPKRCHDSLSHGTLVHCLPWGWHPRLGAALEPYVHSSSPKPAWYWLMPFACRSGHAELVGH